MKTSQRTVWRCSQTNKELLVLEGRCVGLPPYSLEPHELPDLLEAVKDCLSRLAATNTAPATEGGASC